MPDGFIAIDAQWRVTYMNPLAKQLDLLTHRSEATEVTWNLYPPIAGAMAETKLRLAAAERRAVDFEHFFEPWNRWFEVKASPGPRGGLVVYFRDITERKAIEDEQRKLAMIVDSSEDAIIGIDLEGNIMNWNIGAEHLYGYRPDEVLGRSITLLAPPDNTHDEIDILSKVVREERIVHFDTVRLCKSGRKIHVSLSVSPIKDANGRIIGAAKIARDISDRKRAEALLRDADRRKDDFLAVLGHELRNPLAGIVNGVQVLNYIDSLPQDVIEIRGLIERQANQMKRLIDDLLDVSRIARGKVTLRTEPLDLTHLVSQLTADYRARLAEEDLTLEVAVPDDPRQRRGRSRATFAGPGQSAGQCRQVQRQGAWRRDPRCRDH